MSSVFSVERHDYNTFPTVDEITWTKKKESAWHYAEIIAKTTQVALAALAVFAVGYCLLILDKINFFYVGAAVVSGGLFFYELFDYLAQKAAQNAACAKKHHEALSTICSGSFNKSFPGRGHRLGILGNSTEQAPTRAVAAATATQSQTTTVRPVPTEAAAATTPTQRQTTTTSREELTQEQAVRAATCWHHYFEKEIKAVNLQISAHTSTTHSRVIIIDPKLEFLRDRLAVLRIEAAFAHALASGQQCKPFPGLVARLDGSAIENQKENRSYHSTGNTQNAKAREVAITVAIDSLWEKEIPKWTDGEKKPGVQGLLHNEADVTINFRNFADSPENPNTPHHVPSKIYRALRNPNKLIDTKVLARSLKS